MLSFKQRFRLLRGNDSQVQFANKVGITKQKVSNYENGIVKPTYEVLVLLAEELHVNLNWLITGYGNMYIQNPIYSATQERINREKEYLKIADKKGNYVGKSKTVPKRLPKGSKLPT